MNRVSSISFVRNLHFSILSHRVQYLKKITGLEDNRLSFSGVNLKSETKDTPLTSHSLLLAKAMIFCKQKFDVKQLEEEQFYV